MPSTNSSLLGSLHFKGSSRPFAIDNLTSGQKLFKSVVFRGWGGEVVCFMSGNPDYYYINLIIFVSIHVMFYELIMFH